MMVFKGGTSRTHYLRRRIAVQVVLVQGLHHHVRRRLIVVPRIVVKTTFIVLFFSRRLYQLLFRLG